MWEASQPIGSRWVFALVVFAVAVAGCRGPSRRGAGDNDDSYDDDDSSADDDDSASGTDADGDGVTIEDGDCDDGDPTIYPGAPEVWGDEIDQDCDGFVDAAGAYCSSTLTVDVPDGSSTTLDGCADWFLDATFEFDPDDPPEVRSLAFSFSTTTEVGFECNFTVTQEDVCGPGFYDQAGSAGTTTYTLMDCVGIPDEFEHQYVASEGYVRLDKLDAGDDPGNFTGQPLSLTVGGFLSVDDGEGVVVRGDFVLSLVQIAHDAEEVADCAVSDGDADDDGVVSEAFGGEDCDDDDPLNFPGNTEACDGQDNDCDGEEQCRFAQLGAGVWHICGLDSAGFIRCWGFDDAGQSSPPDGTFIDVSSGSRHGCSLDAGGSAHCWGLDDQGQVTAPATTFTDLSVGWFHSCGVTAGGVVECWGIDDGSEFDHGQTAPTATLLNQISSGHYHTCGIDADGLAHCWGMDIYGQSTPPTGTFTQISSGVWHTCGIDEDSLVHCWGRDNHGQSSPPGGSFVEVSSGQRHTCGIRTGGALECWGGNDYGQAVPPGGTFVHLSAGLNFACAVDGGGAVECWGADTYGQASPP